MLVHVTIKDSQSTENIKWFFFFFNLWQILHKYLYTAKVPFSLRSSMHKDEWNICLPVKVFPCCYDFPACTFLLCLKNKYLFLSSLSPNVTTLLYKKKKKIQKRGLLPKGDESPLTSLLSDECIMYWWVAEGKMYSFVFMYAFKNKNQASVHLKVHVFAFSCLCTC